MRTLTLAQALNEAMAQEMRRDKRVFIMGEDVGVFGGPFGVTEGLLEIFGEDRVRDTPISEAGFFAAAVGAAMVGMRPIIEVQAEDFLASAMDAIVNQAAKMRFMSGGQFKIPLVIRAPAGAMNRGAQHSQCLEAWFMHTPGLEIICPSTAYEAKGLMITAIRDENPVLFFEHKYLYGTRSPGGKIPSIMDEGILTGSHVPEEEYTIPMGKASIKREGKDITVIATMLMLHRALSAANELAKNGIDVEVIDPRTLVPLDRETLINSVNKTHHAIIVSEDHLTCGVSAELAQIINEECFEDLKAPAKRIATLDVPIPLAPASEQYLLPDKDKILTGIRELLK